MITTIEKTLTRKIHALPPEEQAKVLEYVEAIEVRVETNSHTNGDIDKEVLEKHQRRMKLVGIGRSKSRTVSQRVDEILAEGINKREGWSLP